MSFQLEQKGLLEQEINDVLNEQKNSILHELENTEDIHESIHEIRKSCKRMRAVFRLVRFAIGEEAYRARNIFIRNFSRELSELRDATALMETLEKLGNAPFIASRPIYLTPLIHRLETVREAKMQAWRLEGKSFDQLRDVIEKNQDLIRFMPFEPVFHNHLAASMAKVYGRAYRAFQEVLIIPHEDMVHKWRKRAKYLQFHFQLLKRTWEPIFSSYYTELSKCSSMLGYFHDLDVLMEEMQQGNLQNIDKETEEHLYLACDLSQLELLHDIIPLGKLLFAEQPKAFERRMEIYLKEKHPSR